MTQTAIEKIPVEIATKLPLSGCSVEAAGRVTGVKTGLAKDEIQGLSVTDLPIVAVQSKSLPAQTFFLFRWPPFDIW